MLSVGCFLPLTVGYFSQIRHPENPACSTDCFIYGGLACCPSHSLSYEVCLRCCLQHEWPKALRMDRLTGGPGAADARGLVTAVHPHKPLDGSLCGLQVPCSHLLLLAVHKCWAAKVHILHTTMAAVNSDFCKSSSVKGALYTSDLAEIAIYGHHKTIC